MKARNLELGVAAIAMTLLLTLALASIDAKEAPSDWPGWRGPHSSGVADGTGYPTSWSTTENVLWKIDLPGRAGSTPVISGTKLFLTSPDDGKNGVLCLDAVSGKQLWRVDLGEERPGKHKKGSGTNPSPVTDGKNVFVYFKSGEFACLDFKGDVLWRKNLQKLYGEDTLWWDLGTSPILTEKHVVIACMQSGPSYIAAFEKSTGRIAWKTDRDLGAPEEAAQSYSTPVLVRSNGREVLVTLGADHVTAHDAESGAELWRAGGLNPTNHKYFRSISGPVVTDGIVIAPYARGETVTAVRMGGKGDVTKTHVLWTKEGIGADVPTPVAVDGKVWVCTDKGNVACLDVKSGKEIWSGRAERSRGTFSSSPILADGKIWIMREDGTTFVLARDTFEVLGKNTIDEFTLATPVFADSRIYLRSFERLWCIGKTSKTSETSKQETSQ